MSNIQSTTAPLTTEIVRFSDDQLATFHGFDVKAYKDGPLKRNYSEPVLKSDVLQILAPYLKVNDLFSLIASTKNWDRGLNLNILMNQFILLSQEEEKINNFMHCLSPLTPTQKTSILRFEVSKPLTFETWEWMNQLNTVYLPYHCVIITKRNLLNKLLDTKNNHLDSLEELEITNIAASVDQILNLIVSAPNLKKLRHQSPLKMEADLFNSLIQTLRAQRPQIELDISPLLRVL